VDEKRRTTRYPVQIVARYGENDLDQRATARDISARGLFLETKDRPDVSKRLHVALELVSGQMLYFEGVVSRHDDPGYGNQFGLLGGFGIAFLRPDELLREVVPETAHKLDLSFATREQLAKSLEDEVAHGAAFVPTETPLAFGTAVTVRIRLEFVGQTLACRGSVAGVLDHPMRAFGKGVMVAFDSAEEVAGQLGAIAKG